MSSESKEVLGFGILELAKSSSVAEVAVPFC